MAVLDDLVDAVEGEALAVLPGVRVVAEHARVAVDDADGILEDAFGPLVGVEVGSHKGAEVGERVVHP